MFRPMRIITKNTIYCNTIYEDKTTCLKSYNSPVTVAGSGSDNSSHVSKIFL